ncbi:specifically androgen-regulated gene protein [Nycticebus coucang]|uniref:specifically androgen-regulated gene protein n=1 Tax=Nycticebus coucang TaxID=9470 RepID=UPI00234E1CD0|nr:specifically androgen-regulated gene protein [Nycticebus coucang]
MPETELWPAGPGSEPVTRIGSCASMMSTTSTRSGSSDSSYDFLSAAEKECLLFLEETIGALDTEADSGLSTDESEPATTPQGSLALPVTQPTPLGIPEGTTIHQEPEPRRVTQSYSSHPPEPQGLGLRSGSYSLPRNIHIGQNQNLKKSTTQANSHIPGDSEKLVAEPEQVNQGSTPSQAPANPQEAAPDLDVALIPPPEAFRDTQPEQCREDGLPKGSRQQSHILQPHMPASPQKTEQISSESMSQKAKDKESEEKARQPQPQPAMLSQNARAEDTPLPSGEDPNARLAPITASKPRKLPPNIVLKSSRRSFHSDPQNWLSRHTETASGDAGVVSSSVQEQRKARREALEKLGLPQDQEEPGFHLSKPRSSIRLKEPRDQYPSPAPAPAPAQPAGAAQISAAVPAAGKPPGPVWGPSPMQPPAPALAQGSSPSKVLIPAQETPRGNVASAKSMPISIPKASRASSPLTQLDSGLTLQKSSIPGLRQMNFKSNTLERSGVGLSSYLSAEKDTSPKTSTSLEKTSFLDKVSPSVLRNSRPRPASLGTGKDFVGIQVGKLADLEQERSSKRLSYQGQSRDKLPRPLCVSVKISPKGIPGEHRREALKKLGLLKE